MAKNIVIRKQNNTAAIISQIRSRAVYVGLPQNSDPYPDGTSVIEVGAEHEFGSEQPRTYTSTRGNKVTVSGVPERSFMRSTAKENRDAWAKKVASGIGSVLKGKIDMDTVLNRVGLIAETDIKKKIVAIDSPPNSPQVIADKGSSNPLVDTGHLIQAITHVIR